SVELVGARVAVRPVGGGVVGVVAPEHFGPAVQGVVGADVLGGPGCSGVPEVGRDAHGLAGGAVHGTGVPDDLPVGVLELEHAAPCLHMVGGSGAGDAGLHVGSRDVPPPLAIGMVPEVGGVEGLVIEHPADVARHGDVVESVLPGAVVEHADD